MPSFLSPLLKTPGQYQLRNERTGLILATHVLTAFDSKSRNTGLLRHDSLPEGHGLIIAPSNAVHTFFMRFSIDLAFVAKDGRVVKTRAAVPPWRLSGALRAFAVVELPVGTLDRTHTAAGDRLVLV